MKFAAAALLGSLMMSSPSYSDPNDTAWNAFSPAISMCIEKMEEAGNKATLLQSLAGNTELPSKETLDKRDSRNESFCVCVYYGIFNETAGKDVEALVDDLVVTELFFINEIKYPGFTDNDYNIMSYMNQMNHGILAMTFIDEGVGKCTESLKSMK